MTKFKFIPMFILLCFLSCQSNDSDDTFDNTANNCNLPTCDDKIILKTFTDEPGFILKNFDMRIDRVCYYFFVPITPYTDFSDKLLFCLKGGITDVDIDKYANSVFLNRDVTDKENIEMIRLMEGDVKISGNVTKCIYTIDGIDETGHRPFEHNILELSTIKKVKK